MIVFSEQNDWFKQKLCEEEKTYFECTLRLDETDSSGKTKNKTNYGDKIPQYLYLKTYLELDYSPSIHYKN